MVVKLNACYVLIFANWLMGRQEYAARGEEMEKSLSWSLMV
jgi:hypothetical protein